MNHTVFLAGCPDAVQSIFIDSAVSAGNQVMATSSVEKKAADAKTVIWSRSSPISARTVLLQAQNTFEVPGQTVLYFDAADYAATYSSFSLETISRGTDDMILGYTYLVNEAVTRMQAADDCFLIFYLHADPEREYGMMTSIAQAAFASLAEKTAEQYAGKNFGVVLVRSEEPASAEFADWLFQFVRNENNQKAAKNPKHAVHWIKPLSRNNNPLTLLKR